MNPHKKNTAAKAADPFVFEAGSLVKISNLPKEIDQKRPLVEAVRHYGLPSFVDLFK